MIFFGTDHSARWRLAWRRGCRWTGRRLRNVVLGRDSAALEDRQEARDSLGCHALVMTMIQPRGQANEAAE